MAEQNLASLTEADLQVLGRKLVDIFRSADEMRTQMPEGYADAATVVLLNRLIERYDTLKFVVEEKK